MHGLFIASISGSSSCLSCCISVIMAKGFAMKSHAQNKTKQTTPKAKAKAKAKAKVGLTEEEKKQLLAAKKDAAAIKGKDKGTVMKKPAGTCFEWAAQPAHDEEAGEEVQIKDTSRISKQQAYLFDRALKLHPGVTGSLPQEVHDIWNNVSHGPGTIPERNDLRNLCVPKDASYGHIIKSYEGGALVQHMKDIFQTKQRKHHIIGISESEMRYTHFQGNKEALQGAIEKGDVTVRGKYYYWERNIHEHITGGKQTFNFGGGNPKHMSQQDMQAMLQLLNFAPWAGWGAKPETECNPATLKAPAKPDSEAMVKLQEGLDAMQAACNQMKTIFKDCRKQGMMTAEDCGSIPKLIQSAMGKVKPLEENHCQPVADLLYNTEGTEVPVSNVKGMLMQAAPAMALLSQQMNEIQVLTQRYRSKKSEP